MILVNSMMSALKAPASKELSAYLSKSFIRVSHPTHGKKRPLTSGLIERSDEMVSAPFKASQISNVLFGDHICTSAQMHLSLQLDKFESAIEKLKVVDRFIEVSPGRLKKVENLKNASQKPRLKFHEDAFERGGRPSFPRSPQIASNDRITQPKPNPLPEAQPRESHERRIGLSGSIPKRKQQISPRTRKHSSKAVLETNPRFVEEHVLVTHSPKRSKETKTASPPPRRSQEFRPKKIAVFSDAALHITHSEVIEACQASNLRKQALQEYMSSLDSINEETKRIAKQKKEELLAIFQQKKKLVQENVTASRLKIRKFLRAMKSMLYKMLAWGISKERVAAADQLYLETIIAGKALSRPDAAAFLQAVRNHENSKVLELLEHDRSLIFEYDKVEAAD